MQKCSDVSPGPLLSWTSPAPIVKAARLGFLDLMLSKYCFVFPRLSEAGLGNTG